MDDLVLDQFEKTLYFNYLKITVALAYSIKALVFKTEVPARNAI